MKKNIAIIVLAVIAAIGIENAIYFGYQSNKLNYQRRVLAKSLSKVRYERDSLERVNDNLQEIVDSFDNPHHHDYLLSLQCYQALQP